MKCIKNKDISYMPTGRQNGKYMITFLKYQKLRWHNNNGKLNLQSYQEEAS